jgi:uncharacterized membrane protein YdfJ with MMPL/SSD domain
MIQMFGLGTAVAIVLDATLIRGVIVPAFMRLAGASQQPRQTGQSRRAGPAWWDTVYLYPC